MGILLPCKCNATCQRKICNLQLTRISSVFHLSDNTYIPRNSHFNSSARNYQRSPNSPIEVKTKSTLSRKAFTEILAILAEIHSNSASNVFPSTDKVLFTWFSFSSLSGERIWRAWEAYNGVGKGILRELRISLNKRKDDTLYGRGMMMLSFWSSTEVFNNCLASALFIHNPALRVKSPNSLWRRL